MTALFKQALNWLNSGQLFGYVNKGSNGDGAARLQSLPELHATFMESNDDHLKIPLPDYLKFFTSNNVPVPKAIAIAGKVFVLKQTIILNRSWISWSTIASYKEYHTRATLATLSDLKLKTVGVESQEDRKLVMAALRKAGYGYQRERRKKVEAPRPIEPSGSVSEPRPSTSSIQATAVEILVRPHIIPPSPLNDTVRRRRRPSVRENVTLMKQMNFCQTDLQMRLSKLLDWNLMKCSTKR